MSFSVVFWSESWLILHIVVAQWRNLLALLAGVWCYRCYDVAVRLSAHDPQGCRQLWRSFVLGCIFGICQQVPGNISCAEYNCHYDVQTIIIESMWQVLEFSVQWIAAVKLLTWRHGLAVSCCQTSLSGLGPLALYLVLVERMTRARKLFTSQKWSDVKRLLRDVCHVISPRIRDVQQKALFYSCESWDTVVLAS